MASVRFQMVKKYIAFLTIVPILMVTALVSVDCPICDGLGHMASLPAMEDVHIIEAKSEEIYVTRDACSVYMVYRYDVILSLVNEGQEDGQGWLKMTLKDNLAGLVVDTQYVAIDIPKQTVLDVTYSVWFGTGLDLPGRTEVEVEVVVGEVPDLVCNGTGRIPLNTLFFVRGLKDTFNRIVKVEQRYHPPVAIEWELFIEGFLDE